MSFMKPLILIVEDEKPIRHFLKIALETQDYDCLEAQFGKEALSLSASHHPDIVILDLGLPDIDGLEVIQKLREWSNAAIIVVSARGYEREKVEALDAGADDYLTKPFSIAELLARIRVSLRKTMAFCPQPGTGLRLGDLLIDFEKRQVKLQNKDIHLTPTEYSLLTMLAKHQGKVLTYKTIINEIWGATLNDDTQTLRVCMGNLRRKIEANPARPRYILTEAGAGYRMADE